MWTLLYLCLIFSAMLSYAPASIAQELPGVVELHAEALDIGFAITLPAASEWSFGIDLSGGKHIGVNLSDIDNDLNLYAVGYAVVRWTPNPSLQVSLSPIGFAGVVGNDFGTFYPSARLGVGHFWARFGVGTEFRVIRIAGSFGTGEYWLQWAPVRVSFRL